MTDFVRTGPNKAIRGILLALMSVLGWAQVGDEVAAEEAVVVDSIGMVEEAGVTLVEEMVAAEVEALGGAEGGLSSIPGMLEGITSPMNGEPLLKIKGTRPGEPVP